MKKIMLALVFVFVLSACASTPPPSSPSTPELPAPVDTPPVETPTPISGNSGTPVALFTETLSAADADNRRWPTERVWRQVQGQEKTVLVDRIGKVGEFPNTYTVSPDGTTLYINLESKLVSIDIKTGEQKTIFTPKNQVNNFIFSRDGKTLFIWDQIYASADNFNYSLHELDLSSGSSKIVVSGDAGKKFLFLNALRDDKTAILYQAMGEASRPWFLDIPTAKLNPVPGLDASLWVSNQGHTGRYVAATIATINDPCNDFSGSESGMYSLRDSVSGAEIARFGQKGKAVRIVAFSPDDREVMYSIAPEHKDATACDNDLREWKYYRLIIKTTPTAESEPVELTKAQAEALHFEWSPRDAYDYRSSEKGIEIYKADQKLFAIPSGYNIIREFGVL